MRALLITAALLVATPLLAQNYGNVYAPGAIETPTIHLGSGGEPSIITVPPVVVEQAPGEASGLRVSNATPASTELLASRHFDYIVSPVNNIVSGSMEDSSLSLGDYARQLRAEKAHTPMPDAMANPAGCN
jgi:hypothetical protein